MQSYQVLVNALPEINNLPFEKADGEIFGSFIIFTSGVIC